MSQKNAIIQAMIEEFLQDWPKESFLFELWGFKNAEHPVCRFFH